MKLNFDIDMVPPTELDLAFCEWVNEGSPLDQNGSVPHDVKMFFVARTLRSYGLTSFVESGTFHGDGVAAMIPYADYIHSIEAWEEAYDYSLDRFAEDPRVHLHFGDSETVLPALLADLPPSVFWLDAHYPGDGTETAAKEAPVVAELKAIAATGNRRHAIVIDDARGFGVWEGYPSSQWIEDFVATEMPNHYTFKEGDEIFIVPYTA